MDILMRRVGQTWTSPAILSPAADAGELLRATALPRVLQKWILPAVRSPAGELLRAMLRATALPRVLQMRILPVIRSPAGKWTMRSGGGLLLWPLRVLGMLSILHQAPDGRALRVFGT